MSKFEMVVESGVGLRTFFSFSKHPQVDRRTPLFSLQHLLDVHIKNQNRKEIVMVREFPIVREGLEGIHDAIFGIRVGLLLLDEATRLASAG